MENFDFGLPKGARVVVAMSGGVDSSVTAAMLHEAGFEVIGLTMQLYDHGAVLAKKGACCAGQDIYDAKLVAEKLGFPHYVLDYESKFKESVIDDFADTYMAGHTPIPCVRCNQTVKFKDLLQKSKELGAVAMATGHYVKKVRNSGTGLSELHSGADKSRDQSYFLFTTTNEQLDYLLFPLGDIEKTEVRKYAQKLDLKVADKPDSQDICFVPDGKYANLVSKLRPGSLEPGDIINIKDNKVLGRHNGIINYTVGQRKGLNVSVGYPLYVVKIDAENHNVYVGPKEYLACSKIHINDLNWLAKDLIKVKDYESSGKIQIKGRAKIRSTRSAVPAIIEISIDENSNIINPNAVVVLDDPEYGVSPGQACVFYDDNEERVLGGGWIVDTEN